MKSRYCPTRQRDVTCQTTVRFDSIQFNLFLFDSEAGYGPQDIEHVNSI